MNKIKGFTLVELLAVIVILAIILVIAIPSITNVIENSKKSTLANNAKVVLKSLKLDYDAKHTSGTFTDTFILYDSGVKTTYPSGNNVDFTFTAKDGGIVLYDDGTSVMAVHDGTYCATKLRTSSDITVTETTKANCIANIYYKQATAPFNTLITNGDFSNGTTGWTPDSATITASNNTLINTGNGVAVYPQFYQNMGVMPSVGHKIYVKSKVRVTNSDCTQVAYMLAASGMSTQSADIMLNPVLNTYYTDSKIIPVATGIAGNASIFIYHRYASNATANGKRLEVQDFIAINLSATYGVGSEPSTTAMDNNIDKVWIDTATANTPKKFTAGGWKTF